MYKVGIIGLGRIAYQLESDPLRGKPCTHVGSWLRQKNIQILAGCDIDANKRKLFLEQFPDAKIYHDYRDMLTEQLDFVSVCAYATDRSAMVINAANAGVKGIWCEKAMACSIAEADLMAEALSRNNAHMIVSYIRRWTPRYQAVKSMLDQQVIGELQTINVHFSGNFLHTGTHAFDLMRYFAGEVESAQAWLNTEDSRPEQSGYRYNGDNCLNDFGGFGILHFHNGVKGSVHGDDKEYFRFEFELLGDKGMIRVGNTQQELWTVSHSDYLTDVQELKRAEFPSLVEVPDWELAATNLIDAVKEEKPVLCGVDDGRNALKIALALHQSHLTGHVPVFIEQVPRDLRVASR